MPRPSYDSLPLARRVEVAPSVIDGNGVFARVGIKKGAYIGTYEGAEAKRNGKYVLWLLGGQRDMGRRGDNELRFLNHADKPNAEFDGWDLYAATQIKKGEEITFNYEPDGV